MRVLMVHSDLQGGGVERVLVTLARHLPFAARGICYCPSNHPEPPDEFTAALRADGLQLFRVRPPLLSLRYPCRLGKVIGAFAPDIVHLHGTSLGVVGGLLRLRFRRAPVFVYTQHPKHSQDARWLRTVARAAFPRIDHLVCVSEAVREDLLALPGLNKLGSHTSVIHNGVDLEPFRDDRAARSPQAVRAEMGIADDELVIGAVGLLWPIKGHHVLLAAMPQVLSRFPHSRLVLVGKGEAECTLKALAAQLEIAERVTFAGWRADVPAVLSALDVYAQPSLSEGLPLAPIEASASGLPIVATRAGGMDQVIVHGETGLLVPPGEPGLLAEALISVLADPSLACRLGTAARERAFSEFSAEAMARQHLELYRSLLGTTRAVESGEGR